MRFRLYLVVLLFLPLLTKGQSADINGVKFYSKGKMYVKYKDVGSTPAEIEAKKGTSESTTLYIDGSAKFVDGSSIVQKGRMEITEDFINEKNATTPLANDASPNLFIFDTDNKPASLKEGVVAFVGKYGNRTNKQRILGSQVPIKFFWDAFDLAKKNLDSDPTNVDLQSKYTIAFSNLYYPEKSLLGTNLDIDNPHGTWNQQKQKKYINFPTIAVEKGALNKSDGSIAKDEDPRKYGYLEVDESAAIKVSYLHVPENNRFSVKASYDAYRNGDITKINSGQALIKNITKIGGSTTESFNGIGTREATYSQVIFDLYKYGGNNIDDGEITYIYDSANPSASTHTVASGNSLRNADGWNRLTGFSPPFEQLGADYMFYHVLTKPSATSITSWEGPVVNPFHRMEAGKGYFMSMEVSHADHDDGPEGDKNINNRWDFEKDKTNLNTGIHNTRRARGGYSFNRRIYHDILSNLDRKTTATEPNDFGGEMDNFSRFVYEGAFTNGKPDNPNLPVHEKYKIGGMGLEEFMDISEMGGKTDRSRYELMTQEKFNTGDVQVKLTKGLNFLGNPFMTPISLNPLLGIDKDGNDLPFNPTEFEEGFPVAGLGNVESGNPAIASAVSFVSADVRTKYWIINNALIKYNPVDNRFHYKVTYDYLSRAGSTTPTGGTVKNNPDGSQTEEPTSLDPSSYRIAPMQMFCLQAAKDFTLVLKSELRDNAFGKTDFKKSVATTSSIMEDWFAVEARDNETNTSDRTSIIFRKNAKSEEDAYDTKKGLTDKLVGEFKDTYTGKTTQSKPANTEGVVYTKSSDDVSMLGNAVPLRTKELALFFNPPAQNKEVTLKFYGMENVVSVPNVWLIDRDLNNKKMKVTQDFEYEFVSKPSDMKGTNGEERNRFVLQFYDGDDDDIIGGEDAPITFYYRSSVLHITGLNDGDINSDVQIYDMQGRLVGKTKVNNAPSMDYLKSLTLGTYIVKITGKRNFTSKFINLQN